MTDLDRRTTAKTLRDLTIDQVMLTSDVRALSKGLDELRDELRRELESVRGDARHTNERRELDIQVMWADIKALWGLLRGENGDKVGLIAHVRELRNLRAYVAGLLSVVVAGLVLAWLTGQFTPATTKDEGQRLMQHLNTVLEQVQKNTAATQKNTERLQRVEEQHRLAFPRQQVPEGDR